MRVLLRKASSATTSRAATTTAVMSFCSRISRPPHGSSTTLSVGMPSSSVIITLFSPPKMISPKPMRNSVMPIVAMKRMMSGWPTSGRSTTRSMVTASTNMTPSVRITQIHAGTPMACRPTRVSAAKTTMMPCAKLKIRLDRKISTNPSAISA